MFNYDIAQNIKTTNPRKEEGANVIALPRLLMAVDAEWVSAENACYIQHCEYETQGQDIPVSVQLSIQDTNGQQTGYVFLNQRLSAKLDEEKLNDWSRRTGHVWDFADFTKQPNLLEIVIQQHGLEPGEVDLVLYYSPKDLQFALGETTTLNLYREGKIKQKRNLKGHGLNLTNTRHTFTVKDMFGVSTGKLEDLAQSVGVPMKDKNELDDLKANMDKALVEHTETFMDYAVGDVVDLNRVKQRFYETTNQVMQEAVGVSIDSEPTTTGALAKEYFQTWLETQLAEDSDAFRFALYKLGVLDSDSKQHRVNRQLFNQVLKQVKSRDDIKQLKEAGTLDAFFNIDLLHTAYSQASVKAFSEERTSAIYNALVQGGRCVNERWSEYSVQGPGADIDLDGCYGTALRHLTYPLGLPSVWGFTNNQTRMTLGEWLKRNEKDLVRNLWQVVVSGNLSFQQDLVFSRTATKRQIKGALNSNYDAKDGKQDDSRDEVSHIPGEFNLNRKEITNGVITSDVLETVRAVASDKQLKEFYNLQVVCAAAYLESDRVNNVEDWIDTVIADKGRSQSSVDGKTNIMKDTRTRAWLPVPMEEYIGKLVEKRKEYKKRKHECEEANAKQELLKVQINTVYGDLASPFFSIGNTIVANNITARARVGCWMLAKAMGTRQSITDGGFYSLMAVPTFYDKPKKLPSLHTLADMRKHWIHSSHKKRSQFKRSWQSLGGKDWEELFRQAESGEVSGDELAQTLDDEATKHIKHFWSHWGLTLPFDIEHKSKNCFWHAAYWNKADYAFDLLFGGRVYKIRGDKIYNDDSALKNSPQKELLDRILDGSDEFPKDLTYHQWSLLKVNRWLRAENGKEGSYENIKGLVPGDEMVEERHKRFNNQHIPSDTHQEFLKRANRRDRRNGVRIPYFERFHNKGISKVHKKMLSDKLNSKS